MKDYLMTSDSEEVTYSLTMPESAWRRMVQLLSQIQYSRVLYTGDCLGMASEAIHIQRCSAHEMELLLKAYGQGPLRDWLTEDEP